jgi:hypothetical protein
MIRMSDLPEIAVLQILRRARGRSIAGTNKYARVCRQWRDAEDGVEPLQLFVDHIHMSEADLSRAASWLSMHGQCVDVLVARMGYALVDPLCSLVNAAPALRNLKHLEVVTGRTLLQQLVPVLRQLPQLQHLAAGIYMSQHPGPNHAWVTGTASQLDPGQQVPHMRELCPQLTSLTLAVHPVGGDIKINNGFLHLFSPRLQQSYLINCSTTMNVSLCASGVGHLSALEQLTLNGVDVNEQGACKLARELRALQQLRMYYQKYDDAGTWAHLAPKLTEYDVWLCNGGWVPALFSADVLSSCVHLTRLVLDGQLPRGTADALAALTGLRELGLIPGRGDTTVEVVQQVAGMAQLRSLQLKGYHPVS